MFLKKLFCKIARSQMANKRYFSEIVKQDDTKVGLPRTPAGIVGQQLQRDFQVTDKQIAEMARVGADIVLTPENRELFSRAGVRFEDINPGVNSGNLNTDSGWKLTVLKNNLLLADYDLVLREFFQAAAQNNAKGLNLTLEPRLRDYFSGSLERIIMNGYQVDIENLKIKQSYKILGLELYKNLSMNRYDNRPYKNYTFSSNPFNPFAPILVATETGVDKNYFSNDKAYVLAATMLVETPMSLVIYNQNRSRKLYGGNDNSTNSFVVRFESQINISDLLWILPTQNKPARHRSTRIADFNNILRGNPFFTENFDLYGGNNRTNYMGRDEAADKRVAGILNSYNRLNRSYSAKI